MGAVVTAGGHIHMQTYSVPKKVEFFAFIRFYLLFIIWVIVIITYIY